MKTLSDKYPEAKSSMLSMGRRGIAELMDHCDTCVDMDNKLGTNGSSNNWMLAKTVPNMQVENKARDVVAAIKSSVSPVQVQAPKPVALTEKTNEIIEAAPDCVTLLVFVPADKADKVNKVLGLMGCDTVEV